MANKKNKSSRDGQHINQINGKSLPEHKIETAYLVSYDDSNKTEALAIAGQALSRVQPIVRTRGSSIYKNVDSDISIRDSFSRSDWEEYRPGEKIPTKPKDIISACMQVYKNNGLIKNIIDLMADFTCQGIDLVHKSKAKEKFYKAWLKKVKMKERSERFLNMLYRSANVVVKRSTAKLKIADVDKLEQGIAADLDVEYRPKPEKREIPWKYTILNPLHLEVTGGDLGQFYGTEAYGYALKLDQKIIQAIRNPDKNEQEIVNKLPVDLVNSVRKGARTYQLPRDKIRAFFYKKDDWDTWACPMTYSILGDLILLQKMKNADLAALDGAISHIRLWRLGSLEHHLAPTAAAIDKLANILVNNVGGGTVDLIWGPELNLQETSTDIHRFLGSEKYAPTLNSIYSGLGIPPTLNASQKQGGFTNNAISLRTLIERLKYGREILIDMWEYELKLVQQAMGHREPPSLVFDYMDLNDQVAEKNLWIQLADRDYISIEALQRRFGEIPEIEMVRQSRERRMRKSGRMPPQAGPFHNANHKQDVEKILLQSGQVAPSEIGIELDPKKDGEETLLDKQIKFKETQQKFKNPNGRPRNVKDTKKRKQKRVLPRTKAQMITLNEWAKDTQKNIASIINPLYLKKHKKRTVRELTDAQHEELESFKFAILLNATPFSTMDKPNIQKILAKTLTIHPSAKLLIKSTLSQFREKFQRDPVQDELRNIQAAVFCFYEASDPDNSV